MAVARPLRRADKTMHLVPTVLYKDFINREPKRILTIVLALFLLLGKFFLFSQEVVKVMLNKMRERSWPCLLTP
jgi:hypothetical protein